MITNLTKLSIETREWIMNELAQNLMHVNQSQMVLLERIIQIHIFNISAPDGDNRQAENTQNQDCQIGATRISR